MMLKRFVAVRGEEDGLVMCFCVDSPADFAEGGAEIEVIWSFGVPGGRVDHVYKFIEFQ